MKTAVLHLDRIGSSCCQLTRTTKTRVACPLRSPGITPVPRYYETVRPAQRISTFGLAGLPLSFSLSTAGRFSSSVPEPGTESRHLYTGHHMASKQVSAMPFPREEGPLRFRCHLLIRFDASSVVHLRSSLYPTHDVISSRLLTMTFTTAAFDRSSSWLFEACSYKPARAHTLCPRHGRRNNSRGVREEQCSLTTSQASVLHRQSSSSQEPAYSIYCIEQCATFWHYCVPPHRRASRRRFLVLLCRRPRYGNRFTISQDLLSTLAE